MIRNYRFAILAAIAAITALVDLLLETKKADIKCAIIRGLGKANAADSRGCPRKVFFYGLVV